MFRVNEFISFLSKIIYEWTFKRALIAQNAMKLFQMSRVRCNTLYDLYHMGLWMHASVNWLIVNVLKIVKVINVSRETLASFVGIKMFSKRLNIMEQLRHSHRTSHVCCGNICTCQVLPGPVPVVMQPQPPAKCTETVYQERISVYPSIKILYNYTSWQYSIFES